MNEPGTPSRPRDRFLVGIGPGQPGWRVLLGFALVGLLIPNGLFLFFAFKDPGLVWSAIQNPVSLAFLVEAQLLMVLCCWLLRRWRAHWQVVLIFVLLSLLGSLAFSVPLVILLLAKTRSPC